MTTPTPISERLTHLLDEMLTAFRSGRREACAEYCGSYPEFADQLRDLFPAMLLMEQHKPIEQSPGADRTSGEPFPRFSDYEILGEIGRGGMGIVFEARQISLRRQVALKVMSRHLSRNLQALERFRREARAAAQLHHTNIVPVFEVGEEGETSFYAMQFIHGQALDCVIEELRNLQGRSSPADGQRGAESILTVSLARTLAHGSAEDAAPSVNLTVNQSVLTRDPIKNAGRQERSADRSSTTPVADLPRSISTNAPIAETGVPNSIIVGEHSATTSWKDGFHYFRSVARIGMQIAEALHYAHGKNVIHRDVKPANILLDTLQTAWITDFGLATIGDDSPDSPRQGQLTQTGDVVGTLRYMAPERLQGLHDAQSDIYGLGVTLYELLTLEPALQANDRAQLLDQVVHRQPPNPRSIAPRIPRDLETIVLKAIHKEPKRRYSTAREMADDLRRFIAHEPIRARRVGPIGRFQLWYRRNRWLAIGVCLSVVSLAILSVGSVIASFTFKSQRDQANYLRGQMEHTELERKHKSWEAYLEAAHGLRLSRAPGQRYAALRAVKAALELPLPPGRSIAELRTEAMAALCLPDFEVADRWQIPTDAFVAGLNHDLTLFAQVDPQGNVSICRVAHGEVLHRLPSIGVLPDYFSVRFSSDDSIVAQFNGDQLRIWRITASEPDLVAAHDGIAGFDFDPRGNRLALLTRANAIQIWDLSGGPLIQKWNLPFPLMATRIVWNPRRDLIAIGPRLLDLVTGQCQRIKLPVDEIENVTWDPSGRVLSFCDARGVIYLWDIDRQEPFSRLLQPKLHGGTLTEFSRSGDRLLATNWGQMWDLYDVASGRQLMSLRAGQTWLGFSLDDQIVGLDCWHGECRLFRFAGGRELRYIRADAPQGSVESERQIGKRILSLDGRFLLFDTSGLTQIVDLVTGKSALEILLPGRPLVIADDSLLTYGDLGLLRWTNSESSDGTRRIGPPQSLANPGYGTEWAYDSTRKLIVVPRRFEATLVGQITSDGFRELFQLGTQRDVRFSAISPDGRWIATGSHGSGDDSGCKIWSAESGALVAELPIASVREIQFSPDCKWLLTLGLRPQLWETKTWMERKGLSAVAESAHGCFADDSQVIVLEDERGMVRLLRTTDGSELTRFAIPDSTRLWPFRLARDGRLQMISAENDSIYEVDLGRIRGQLKDMGLDWDQSPFDPIVERTATQQSFTCELGEVGRTWQLDSWNALGNYYSGRGEYDLAVSAFRRVLTSDPHNASANNSLAWLMVSEPAHLRNPPEAVRLARLAVQQHPEDAAYWNTLGTACYRDGRYEEAIDALQKSEQRQQDTPEYDWLFLAMSHAQVGHADEARSFFERAQKSIQERSNILANSSLIELGKFLDEARKLLAEKADSAQQ